MLSPAKSRFRTRGRRFKSCQPDSERVSAGQRPSFVIMNLLPGQSTPLVDPLTRQVTKMPLMNLDRLCEGLESGDWAGFLKRLGPQPPGRESPGDHPVQLPSRRRPTGQVSGGRITGSGRGRCRPGPDGGDEGSRRSVPGVDDRDPVRVDRAEQTQRTAAVLQGTRWVPKRSTVASVRAVCSFSGSRTYARAESHCSRRSSRSNQRTGCRGSAVS